MFKKTMLLLVLGSIFSATPAFADNCDNARNTFDEFYCKDKLYQQADKDLNTAYGELSRKLSANDRKTLKEIQLDWMHERDTQCIEKRDDEVVLFVNCRLNRTVDQTNFLNQRLRECKSTGCQPSRLRD